MPAAGGQGGIRTHDTLAGMPHFECGAFNHSTTCPAAEILERPRNGKANPTQTLASSALRAAGWIAAIPVPLRFPMPPRQFKIRRIGGASWLRRQSFGIGQPLSITCSRCAVMEFGCDLPSLADTGRQSLGSGQKREYAPTLSGNVRRPRACAGRNTAAGSSAPMSVPRWSCPTAQGSGTRSGPVRRSLQQRRAHPAQRIMVAAGAHPARRCLLPIRADEFVQRREHILTKSCVLDEVFWRRTIV
jgi:hypothetical protein